ncbi:hypothetical protein ACLOJK_018593, partial [Asimina triloba]
MAVPLDDFEVILELEFLRSTQVFVGIIELVSTLQLKDGLRKGQRTYIATLVGEGESLVTEVPNV